MRDKLVKMLAEGRELCEKIQCEGCRRSCKGLNDCIANVQAEHLLANGVIVPPCKVGDTVYVCNRTAGKIFKNKVVGIFLSGASSHRNGIKCEYRNICGETSNRKFTFAQIGKTIFLTREEAEQALKEKE